MFVFVSEVYTCERIWITSQWGVVIVNTQQDIQPWYIITSKPFIREKLQKWLIVRMQSWMTSKIYLLCIFTKSINQIFLTIVPNVTSSLCLGTNFRFQGRIFGSSINAIHSVQSINGSRCCPGTNYQRKISEEGDSFQSNIYKTRKIKVLASCIIHSKILST